jgi:hypothetical protein
MVCALKLQQADHIPRDHIHQFMQQSLNVEVFLNPTKWSTSETNDQTKVGRESGH